MKATVHKILNGSLWCVCPQREDDLFFGISENTYEYIKKYAIPIYKQSLIIPSFFKSLKDNDIINGDLIRENKKTYFIPREAKYIENEPNKLEISKTNYAVTAIMAIIGREKMVPITEEQYNFIKRLGKEENSIRTYVSNGFTIDKYLIYGKLGAKNQILFPRIKIIHNN